MPAHDIQDIGELVADLRRKHPRLVLLIGETHSCGETRKMEHQILTGANVGFFEVPKEDMRGIPRFDRKVATGFRDILLKHNPDPTGSDMVHLLPVPEYAVFMDESHEKRNKALLAYDALGRLVEDKVSSKDPVAQAVKHIVLGRSDERVRTSNEHMAGVMVDYLKEHFPDKDHDKGGAPFFAVAMVGAEHIKPQQKKLATKSNLKKALEQQGYDVVTLELIPVKFTSPQIRKDGDYRVYRGHPDEPSIDFGIQIRSTALTSERAR